MFKTTKALVLREVKYKDADKILTVLTESDGKMTVKARGAMRKSCKFSAASQMLTYSELTLFGSNGKWNINEAETIEQFLPLRGDIANLALASYFAEALESVSDEDSPNPAMLQLGLNSLFALSRGLYAPEHIKAVFELRLMCLSGFTPDVFGCAICGNYAPEDAMFSLNGGIVHCRACPPGTSGVSLPVCRETVDAMEYIINAPSKKIFSFTLPPESEKQLCSVTEAYMTAQLERGFGALDYWKTVNFKG
jgi:DNA repair protein RecO (recombination protein O)